MFADRVAAYDLDRSLFDGRPARVAHRGALDLEEGRCFSHCSLSTKPVRIVEICGLRCLVEGACSTSEAS
jgi:hypothetical protein